MSDIDLPASKIHVQRGDLKQAKTAPFLCRIAPDAAPDRDPLYTVTDIRAAVLADRARRAEPLPEQWDCVAAEVTRAIAKFPTWPTDPLHALAVLGEEFGELTKAVLQATYEPHKTTPEEIRSEAIQTAAMAMRLLASLDIYVYERSDQHRQTADRAAPSPEGL